MLTQLLSRGGLTVTTFSVLQVVAYMAVRPSPSSWNLGACIVYSDLFRIIVTPIFFVLMIIHHLNNCE